MPRPEPRKVAGLQMLVEPDVRDGAGFYPVAADAVDAGPAPIGASRVYAFYESAVEAADHAASVEAVSGTAMKVGVARILPGIRVRDAHELERVGRGGPEVDDNDGDRPFPDSPLVASAIASDVRAAGADGMHLGSFYDSGKTILFDAASFVVEGSFSPEHAAEIDRTLGMYEQRGVADRIVGVASCHFDEPEASFAP